MTRSETALRILLANEREDDLRTLGDVLDGLGHEVVPFAVSVREAVELIAREDPDVAFVVFDGDGPLAGAVVSPSTQEEFSAARGEGAGGLQVRTGRRLQDALVSTFLDPRVLRPDDFLALADAAALVRTVGAGSLELAWVAAGRIDAWAQRDTAPWDWLPGALLVTQAGGEARVIEHGSRWHLAGHPALLDEIESALR